MKKIFGRFYSAIFRNKGLFLLGVSIIIIGSVCGTGATYFLKLIVDGFQSGDQSQVLYFLALFGFGKIFQTLCWGGGARIFATSIGRSFMSLRKDILQHIHRLDFAYHTNKSSGSLISMFRRGEIAFFMMSFQLHTWALPILIEFLVISLVIFQLNVFVSFMVVGTVLVNCLVLYFSIRHNIHLRKKMNRIDDGITGAFVDNIANFDTVKYFAKEESERVRYGNMLKPYYRAHMKYTTSFLLIDLVNGSLVALGFVGIVWYSVVQTLGGFMSVGDLLLIIAFCSSFFPQFFALFYQLRDIAKNYSDVEQYFGFLDTPVQVEDMPQSSATKKWQDFDQKVAHEIAFQDVDFSYEKNNEVIHKLNLDIQSGESVALVGKSGAGKSTLIKLLLRFYDLDSGKIQINGVDISEITKTELRSRIGIVPQETILFNNTIEHNIGYGKEDYTQEDIWKAIDMANLREFIEGLPDGLDTIVGERGIKLSGGQKQRVGIARAFIEDAPIIVFDEATSNLDSESEKLIQESFWNVAKDKTTIIIAHRLSTVQKCDRIIVIDEGKIVEEGTHSELAQKNSGIYKHLLELQNSMELT